MQIIVDLSVDSVDCRLLFQLPSFMKSERRHLKTSNARHHSRHSWDSTKTTAAHAWLAFHSLWLRILTGLRRKFGKALLYFCHVEDFNSFQFCICPYNKADPAQQNLCSPFPTESMSCACWRPQVGSLLVESAPSARLGLRRLIWVFQDGPQASESCSADPR